MPSASERDLELWAASGAMALTGRPDGPPLVAPGRPAGFAQDALDQLATAARQRTGTAPDLPGIELLGERAAISSLSRQGPHSCGGSFRLVPTRDGFLGLSLPRSTDVGLVPALVEDGRHADPWELVGHWAAEILTTEATARCRLLGLACAGIPIEPVSRPPVVGTSGGSRVFRRERPLVLDLSSLWAGPLCTQLLHLCGAEVIKVESIHRPDGARSGPAAFFDLLHAGKQMVALDLTTRTGRDQLRALAGVADLVVEASRPRAMLQLGLVAEDLVAAGTSWLSITARGRASNDIGFGDDVAVGAGLVAWDHGVPMPCGDALADPLTGLVAAAAAMSALGEEDASLIDVSMEAVCASAIGPVEPHTVTRTSQGWELAHAAGTVTVEPPRVRRPTGRAGALGADNATVLR